MDTMVSARVPAEVKKQACKALEALGVTPSQAINSLFEYLATNQCLPEFRSEEQLLFNGRERVLEPETLTPKMKQIIKAMRSIQALHPIDWGADANKTTSELIDEARRERLEAILGY
jgi:addiction module RelB/DinJ family antitoxin